MTDIDGGAPLEDAVDWTVAHALERTSPTARELVREHVEDNFGEVLSTLLLADVGRWFIRAHLGTDQADIDDVDRAAAALSECYENGDELMRTVVSTGFLEAMPYAHEDDRPVVEHLPTPLRERLRTKEKAKPPRL